MKPTLLRFLSLLALLAFTARAADDKLIAAVRAADEERTAATKSAEPKRLDAIFSDELRYAHSSGKVDDKGSYVKALTSRSTVYESFDYKERKFIPAGPGVVLMVGRVIVTAGDNGAIVPNDLNFLAVWREEKGKWRFLAWQSCKNLPSGATAPVKK
jgi:hypothetical protein